MSAPRFTIAIPTKNRPDRLENALRSVLDQSFDDVEVVVCDNSDDDSTSASVVERAGDPRVRYLRTNGQLSMPDNWETAVSQAAGEYVGVLTDRSVFRRDALEIVDAEIAGTGARVVSWFNDLYGRDPGGTLLKRRPSTKKRYQLQSASVLDYFVHGHPKYATKIVPKLMTSVCHRSILDEMRASGAGRCCPPVAPDFTSGFLMLAHSDWILTIDEAMYVSCGTGNGAAFRRRGELADRFRRDLGMTWDEMVDRMPSDACFAHALVLNDLMRVRDLVPDRLANVDLDHAQYYLGCMNDYVKTARQGLSRDEDIDILLDALKREPDDVRELVEHTKVFAQTVAFREASVDGVLPQPPPAAAAPDELRFDTVFDALAWDAAHPREPAAAGFLDELPRIEDMKRHATKKRAARPPDQPSRPGTSRSLGERARRYLSRAYRR